jgi:hypothetical protein
MDHFSCNSFPTQWYVHVSIFAQLSFFKCPKITTLLDWPNFGCWSITQNCHIDDFPSLKNMYFSLLSKWLMPKGLSLKKKKKSDLCLETLLLFVDKNGDVQCFWICLYLFLYAIMNNKLSTLFSRLTWKPTKRKKINKKENTDSTWWHRGQCCVGR